MIKAFLRKQAAGPFRKDEYGNIIPAPGSVNVTAAPRPSGEVWHTGFGGTQTKKLDQYSQPVPPKKDEYGNIIPDTPAPKAPAPSPAQAPPPAKAPALNFTQVSLPKRAADRSHTLALTFGALGALGGLGAGFYLKDHMEDVSGVKPSPFELPLKGMAAGAAGGTVAGYIMDSIRNSGLAGAVGEMYDDPMPGERRKEKLIRKRLYESVLPGYRLIDELKESALRGNARQPKQPGDTSWKTQI